MAKPDPVIVVTPLSAPLLIVAVPSVTLPPVIAPETAKLDKVPTEVMFV